MEDNNIYECSYFDRKGINETSDEGKRIKRLLEERFYVLIPKCLYNTVKVGMLEDESFGELVCMLSEYQAGNRVKTKSAHVYAMFICLVPGIDHTIRKYLKNKRRCRKEELCQK